MKCFKLQDFLVLIMLFLPHTVISASTPIAVFDKTSTNFGAVKQGQIISQSFSISNQGSVPLIINKIEFSLSGMKARVKQEIAPKKTELIKIDWDTKNISRQAKGQVLLYLNDEKHPKVTLTLTGTVIAPIDILPYPAVYLSQFREGNAQRNVTIKNNQKTELKITLMEPKGMHFHAALETIQPGKVYKINVTTPPNTLPGRYREALIVHTNDPEHKRLHIEMNILVKDDVFISQEDIDFGKINLLTIKHTPSIVNLLAQKVLIKRKEGKMKITSMTSDIPFLNLNISPDEQATSFELDVNLLTEKLEAGKFDGSINIETNDPQNSQLVIPVKIELL